METIKDFFKELKDRLTSPLIGSFIIAWLLINWQIPLVLIFYKQSEIKLESQNSFIGFIKSQYSWWTCFAFPLLVALFYVFLYPYIRNCIAEYVEKRKIKGQANLLKIAKAEGFVSIARHQLLQGQLNDKITQLTTFYQEQTKIETQYLEKEAKVAELESQIGTLRAQIDQLRNRNNTSIPDIVSSFELSGRFQIKSFSDPTGSNIMSLSNWQIIDLNTIKVNEEFRFDGTSLNQNIKTGNYKIFNIGISMNNDLMFQMEDMKSPPHSFHITLRRGSNLNYNGLINSEFQFAITKVL
ncbi:hypothetical protein ACJVDH_00280 [Pedobacter sp. AW1-32]|uniref:hypothetical protein n=1 Tax=Pedobacter sp. AW1-32 TaxID=3383026 RepID=UPI003FEE1016